MLFFWKKKKLKNQEPLIEQFEIIKKSMREKIEKKEEKCPFMQIRDLGYGKPAILFSRDGTTRFLKIKNGEITITKR